MPDKFCPAIEFQNVAVPAARAIIFGGAADRDRRSVFALCIFSCGGGDPQRSLIDDAKYPLYDFGRVGKIAGGRGVFETDQPINPNCPYDRWQASDGIFVS